MIAITPDLTAIEIAGDWEKMGGEPCWSLTITVSEWGRDPLRIRHVLQVVRAVTGAALWSVPNPVPGWLFEIVAAERKALGRGDAFPVFHPFAGRFRFEDSGAAYFERMEVIE
jgi:hypothetical protein